MEFQTFLDQFDRCDLLDLDDSELALYSRQDLQGKSNLIECICYPDRMIDGWELKVEKLLQVPFAYIVHDKDNCKVHCHFMISWNNNVQLKYFVKYINQFLSSDQNDPCCVLIQDIKNPEGAFNYLTHDTAECRSKNKYQYSKLALHCCNGFDIHFIRQLDNQKKYLISKEISDHIKNYNLMDIMAVMDFCNSKGQDYYLYLEGHSGFFDRLCGANWKKEERKKKDDKR